jgi:pyruvate/2-oxoglutarate dehydrogenase complex dihydrolipoamide acyltransferase (E2) component
MGQEPRPLANAEALPISDDRVERIPLGWRWIDDAFRIAPVAGGFVMELADMTVAKAALRTLRDAKIPATMTHLIVRASALALARNPECHRLACNYKRLTPARVDIGLSMAGHTTYAPIVVLPAVDRKPLFELVPDIIEAVDVAIDKEKRDLKNMRRQMWVIPFGILRRFILRLLNLSLWFRRRLSGTFQVSVLPSVDAVVPLLFYTGSLLGAGAVRDRVVGVDGKPEVRPTIWLTLCADHVALDGVLGARLLAAIKGVLEGDELLTEAREASAARRSNGLKAKPVAQALPAPAPGDALESRRVS